MLKAAKVLFLIILIITEISCTQESTQTKSIVNINLDRTIGTFRPLHGGTLGPVSDLKVLDYSDFYKECKIPLVRLEAVTWESTYAVDISTIFRDFREDPSKAENYDFRRTDEYIASIVKTDVGMLYRLGETIEWTKRKYNIHPPLDYEKWAAICCGIIRHYNDGWANGFHYNIKYWEIWNEPDNNTRVKRDGPANWTGSDEQFFELYEIAAKTIKKSFPSLKVGGPAVCTFNIKNGIPVASDFIANFLSYSQKHSVPLDFFSWHLYSSNPWELSHVPTGVRNILNQYGFHQTESILDEWNYIPGGSFGGSAATGSPRVKWYKEQRSVRGGAFLANVLMLLQDEPLDAATLFTTGNGEYGLISDMGEMFKSTCAFKAFAELVNNTPVRLETQYNKEDSLIICAGTNKEKTDVAILVSNFTSTAKKMDFTLTNNFLTGPIKYELYVVDETNDFSKAKSYEIKNNQILRIAEDLEGPSLVMLKLVSAR